MESTTISLSQEIDDLNLGDDVDGDIDGMDTDKLSNFSEDEQQKLLEVFPNKNNQDILPHQVQQQHFPDNLCQGNHMQKSHGK